MSIFNRLTKQTLNKTTCIRSPLMVHSKPKRLYSTTAQKQPLLTPSPKAFTWKSGVVLAITAVGLGVYFKNEKEKFDALKAKRKRDAVRGQPNIGQPFTLLNANEGKLTTSEELMKGRFSLIYFGFTHCPDICPEELDKMAQVVDRVTEEVGLGILRPIFITCDPLRDTEPVVKAYVEDFHPELIGLTGPPDVLKKVARSYRVYAYTPPNVLATDDYLVDHSIFFYLMNPEGKFVECYARDTTPDEVYESFKNYMKEYLEEGGKLDGYSKK